MIRLILGLLGFSAFVVWANVQVQRLTRELDRADDRIAQCEETVDTLQTLSAGDRQDRDIAERRAKDNAHLMRKAYAAEMNASYALMRANSAIAQLRGEIAQVKANASQQAAVVAAAPAPKKPPRRKKARSGPKKAQPVRRAGHHDWWIW